MTVLPEVRDYAEAMAAFWFSKFPEDTAIDGVTDAVFDGIKRGLGHCDGSDPYCPNGLECEASLPCVEAARLFGPKGIEGPNIERAQIETVVRGVHGSKRDRVKSDQELCALCKACQSIAVHCDPETCLLHQGNSPETSDEVKQRACEILESGDPMTYITDACGQMVLGAETAFRKLICCVAVQSINQSAGLHPKLNGESGSGKSWAVTTFAHHLPEEAVTSGSSSNLALFYHDQGDRLFRILDDYRAGNETLDTIIKQTTSVYHQKYVHRTVVRQAAKTLHAGAEQTWAITSVDASQDIQVLNRQIPINLDDSIELTQQVNRHTISRYGRGEAQFSESEDVLVCREMWRVLRDERYVNIRVPFYERIEWMDNSNRRNTSIFMDLVVAHTYMNHFQREQAADGFYLATEADFEAAKALFCEGPDADELVHRLSRKEREFCELLKKNPGGLTRHEVATAMGVSRSRVSQLARGERGNAGLTQKIPAFDIRDVSRRINESDTERVTVYVLKGFDSLRGFDSVVRLNPKDGKDGKQGVSTKVSEKNSNSSSIVSSSKYSKEKDTLTHSPVETEDKQNFSISNPENANSANSDSKRHNSAITPELTVLTDLTGPNTGKIEMVTPSVKKPKLRLVRFVEDWPQFVGVNGINYGPFSEGDLANIPEVHAKNLFKKNAVVGVNPGEVS